MNFSAPFISRPVMTTFLMLAIVITGIMAFTKLPVSDLPTIESPKIHVSAGYTGASPETVLHQLTIPLEKELTHVKGIREISSVSSPGSSSIVLKFDLSKNMNEALRDVQAALNRADAKLPKEVDPRPSYKQQEGGQEPIMYFLLTSDSSSTEELRSYADAYILPRLNRIEGVAQVLAYSQNRTIWLRVNPDLMNARKIGFNQVIETVRNHTSQLPLGNIQTGSKTLAIELAGSIAEAAELENLQIGNSSVKIKDIAVVSNKSDNAPEFHFVTLEKTSLALILGLQKVSDANTVAISKEVQAVMGAIKHELPSSMHFELWFNKAIWIEDSILDVEWSLLFAFLLVVLVIYFSLGKFSEALISSVALPLSLLGTFGIMYLLNFSLDLLSLLALTLSVGFVVDDAIVVLENIIRNQESGKSAKEASLFGSKQICFTIISITISLVAVFIPLLFMGGTNGRLFREFSITLAVSILVSGFIALTLIPMLCSRFLPEITTHNRLQKAVTATNSWMVNLYGKSLKCCFQYPKTLFLIALTCMGIAVPLFMKLPVNLVPPEDRGFLFAFVNLPSGLAQEEIKGYQSKLEALIQQKPYVENFLGITHEGGLFFVVRLLPREQRQPQPAIIAELNSLINAIPGVQAFTQGYNLINLDFDLGSGGKFKYIVKGLEFADVEKAIADLTKALQSNSQFSFVHSSLKNDTPKLVMHVNEDVSTQYGFSKHDIQSVLLNAYGQNKVGSIGYGAKEETIYLELLPEYQQDLRTLAKLQLHTSQGSLIPLKAFAHWEEKLGSKSLVHHEQLPSGHIKFSFVDTLPVKEGLKNMEQLASSFLSDQVSGSLEGSAKAISKATQELLLLLLAAALVMYLVLGILYESFIHPLTILSSLPFAGLGGALTLYFFNEPISIFSAVGFLLLIGIVKKNGIMMIDYALEAQKTGLSPQEAIYQGCLARFRPIMMTTIAAIMGALPIAIGFGDGAETRQGLGLVIVGGLLFSQLLTLYFTPILYLAFEKLKGTSPKERQRH